MGASAWNYFTPYQPDINQALHSLREMIFAKGNYYSLYTPGEEKREAIQDLEYNLSRLDDLYPDPEEQEYMREYYEDQLTRLKQLPEPTTIAEKIKQMLIVNAESGSHSILDIEGISSEPEYMMAAPLSASELTELFGTTQPVRSLIEAQKELLYNLRQSWMATYIVVYKDGLPDELYFTGFSGD